MVLQFAFDGSPDNPHLPEHHLRNSVVYTGTHDNDTTVGWYASLDPRLRDVVHGKLGVGPAPPVPDCLIDAAYASNAALAIVPMQDLLARDSGARMNTPGTVVGNWRWRFSWDDVPAIARRNLPRARDPLWPLIATLDADTSSRATCIACGAAGRMRRPASQAARLSNGAFGTAASTSL